MHASLSAPGDNHNNTLNLYTLLQQPAKSQHINEKKGCTGASLKSKIPPVEAPKDIHEILLRAVQCTE
jgi:hypothetical protein